MYPPHIDVSSSRLAAIAEIQGPTGSLATFLRELGPNLLQEYSPKAIVVFSAHWESTDQMLVSNYDGINPLLMDCMLRLLLSVIVRASIGELIRNELSIDER